MKDTPDKVDIYWRKLMMQKSGEERLIMGCSMFDFTKEIVISSIKHENPDINNKDLKIELFNRFYAGDFLPEIHRKIVEYLKSY